ncbi:BACON domain-containing protein [Streptomyces tsukubensis]|uniref:BACON domain-containing protein n=1 Tax=Streptomyces tsukubensis TaxID=83656 RepID=A0A1V3ZZP2_9ACTN|nr:BACON domain-containing protein [Streptomyces tsukubensis]OON71648.1 hypothetical protein B1H18_32940 [Streptomyces tsukubensis]QFR95082.1 hypothetical protein GBW32_21220 [Streptomyces tsukubensis]
MSSRTEHSTRAPGARRADHRVSDPAPQPPPSRDDAQLDGLFTYCLSVLCDHEAATAALGDVLALAERRQTRTPVAGGERRAWLYALARWACLRSLAEKARNRPPAHAAGRNPAVPGDRPASERPSRDHPCRDHPSRDQPPCDHPPCDHPPGAKCSGAPSTAPKAPHDHAHDLEPEQQGKEGEESAGAAERDRRAELQRLAWPEAAGTTPEQREALELAVRHRLAVHEIAAVIGSSLPAARELLAAAACEVERTRAALAVAETGDCPLVARLTFDRQILLGTALRTELVRHVDDCPRCRRTAESTGPGTAWPGTSVTPAELPVVVAPRSALHLAKGRAPRERRRGESAPHFDRRGFPMDPKDRAARRDRFRARAVTTTVVATVVAAPVLALWAAYRGVPFTGEGQDGGRSISAAEDSGPGTRDDHENPGSGATARSGRVGKHDVSVQVIGAGAPASKSGVGPARLTVSARPGHGMTFITLTASGSKPVRWSMTSSASWLQLSKSSGTLTSGHSLTVTVRVLHGREPAGPWRARIAVNPSAAAVALEGRGGAARPPAAGHGSGGHGTRPRPTTGPTSRPGPDPTPEPTKPGPDPTPTGPGPGPDPTTADPDPTPPAPDPTETEPGDVTPPEGGGAARRRH